LLFLWKSTGTWGLGWWARTSPRATWFKFGVFLGMLEHKGIHINYCWIRYVDQCMEYMIWYCFSCCHICSLYLFCKILMFGDGFLDMQVIIEFMNVLECCMILLGKWFGVLWIIWSPKLVEYAPWSSAKITNLIGLSCGFLSNMNVCFWKDLAGLDMCSRTDLCLRRCNGFWRSIFMLLSMASGKMSCTI
jgi:hypothetical protein